MKKILKYMIALLSLCMVACQSMAKVEYEEQIEIPNDFDMAERLRIALPYFLNDGSQLLNDVDGQEIGWAIKEGNARVENGVLYKEEFAQEYEKIVLEATVVNQSYEFEALLLDPYVAHIISYFSENGEEKETMKLAYTFNGVYWFKLNHDQAVLKATLGTKRLRDPSLLRKKDGSFVVLATQGYDTSGIYAFDTQDMIDYQNERILYVNASSPELVMSRKQAWAPEGFYDPYFDTYILYWSSVKDGGMFYNTSSDLYQYSLPRRFADVGFPVIDGTLVHDRGKYTLVLKDERQPMEEHSQLFVKQSDFGWWNFSEDDNHKFISGHQSEGPMFMKDFTGIYDYFLFYDDYTRFQFHAMSMNDGKFEKIEDKELLIPLQHPAHSHALPVTWKELERILKVYE